MKKLLLLLPLLMSLPAMAANWYVSKAATGSNAGTSWTNAWNEMNQINYTSVACGDTIWVAGGTTYTTAVTPTKVCTSGNVLTIQRVLSSDSVPVAAAGWSSGFDSTVNNAGTACDLEGDYTTLSGRVAGGWVGTTAAGGGNSCIGATTRSTDGNTIDHMKFIGPACAPAGNCTTAAYGINIAPSTNTVNHMTVQYTELYNMSELFRSSNWENTIIQYNKLHDIFNDGVDHEDIVYTYPLGPSGNVVWRYNTIYNSPNDGIFFEFGGASNWYFYRNVFYGSQFSLLTTKAPGTYGPMFFYNNTFESSTGPCSSNCAYVTDNGSTMTGVVLRNNAFVYVANSLVNAGESSDYNAYSYTTYGGFSWPSGETHSLTYNPGSQQPFVSVSTGDFHLVSNSTVLHAAGTNLGAPYNVDMDGNVAPSSGAWDIGAYQFSSAKTLVSITVLPPSDGFRLTGASGTATLTASCFYSDSSTDNCTSAGGVTWFSDNTATMTVNSSGIVTGAGGTCTGVCSTILAYNGAIYGHAQMSINPTAISTLTSRPETSSSVIMLGTTVLLSAVADASSDNTPVGGLCSWTSSNPSVAAPLVPSLSKPIVQPGEIVGLSVGSATITCTFDGQVATRTVTVANPTVTNTTWYVRPDGGTRYDAAVTSGQCSGIVNAAYPGSGTNQACAFNDVMYCQTDETSSTVYTGAMQPGDTCMVAPKTGGYGFPYKTPGGSIWVNACSGSFCPPSGTPANHTKLVSTCYPSCTTAPGTTGNRSLIVTGGGFDLAAVQLEGVQNFDLDGLDIDTGQDCNGTLSGIGSLDFACASGHNPFIIMSDSFTANINLNQDRLRGASNAWTGTPGPGVVAYYTSSENGFLDGWNFDDPFGYNGNRTDGFTGQNMASIFSGFTEEQPKTVTAVSRDGAGNLNVTFAAGQWVNYIVGTNLTLAGMTPSDLNGTFPVTAINFNQQTATITGGTGEYGLGVGLNMYQVIFTTAAPPTFTVGSFVNITGEPAPYNGTYEVDGVSSTGFTINVSLNTHPSWGVCCTTITAGSALTANALTAAAAGSAETASVLGTAGHVYMAHRGFDQAVNGNGDAVGSGNNTIGDWKCDHCLFHHSMQDNWDMLHSNMSHSTLTNTLSYAAEGAPAKFGGADYGIEDNNLLIANCMWAYASDPNFPPDYNQYLGLPCRAGDAQPIAEFAWSNMVISNNTWESAFGSVFDDSCQSGGSCGTLSGTSIPVFQAQNNIILGYLDTNQSTYNGNLPTIYFSEGGNPAWNWVKNMSYNTRNPPVGGTANQWTTNPTVVTMIPNITSFAGEINALAFNMNLQPGSPAIAAGVANSYVPATDFSGATRPSPGAIGALEPVAAPTVATPTASPGAGTYTSTQTVTLSTATGGATICYTTSGATPAATTPGTCDAGSTTYSGAITVAATATIKALGTLSGDTNSSVATFAYTITPPATVATPTASPSAGTYGSAQSVTLSTVTAGATICYTTDGSTPAAATPGTCSHGSTYSGAITVSATETIKALGTLSGDINSGVLTAAYTISANQNMQVFGTVLIQGQAATPH